MDVDSLRARVERVQGLMTAVVQDPDLLDSDGWPLTRSGGCCRVCGRWTPADRDEAHDHLSGCAAEAAHRAFTTARGNLDAAGPDLAALVTDLWAVLERQDAERDAMRADLARFGEWYSAAMKEFDTLVGGRGAALAEVERLRLVGQHLLAGVGR